MTAPSFDKILVAIDNSPRAPQVLAAAIEVARRFQGRLVLFRAVGIPTEMPPEVFSQPPSAVPHILESHAREDLAARARDVPGEMLAKVAVRIGVPWQAICQEAVEEDVDLVVLGSHGYSGIDHLIGTTASRVANHVDRPVLIVRDKPAPKRDA